MKVTGLDDLDAATLGAILASNGVGAVSRIAAMTARAPSSVYQHLGQLCRAGLVAHPTYGIYILTDTGRWAYAAWTRGQYRPYRNQVRCHALEVQVPIWRMPNQSAIAAAFPGGVRVVQVNGWPKGIGELVVGGVDLKVQINERRNLVITQPDVWDWAGHAAMVGMERATSCLRDLQAIGFRFGEPFFQKEPEYAWFAHPAGAKSLDLHGGKRHEIWEDSMWVDFSPGKPRWELEVHDRWLAVAVESTAYWPDTSLKDWLADVQLAWQALREPS